jgi:hypothetical protein
MGAPDITPPAGGGGGGGISGSGTADYLAQFTGSTAIGDSPIRASGTNVAIDISVSPSFKLSVNGDTNIVGRIDAISSRISTMSSGLSSDLVLQRDGVEAARIIAGGLLGVGCTNPANTLETYASGASGIRASSDTLANITVSQTSGNAVGATLTMRKTRGNRASPSLVNSGDAIGTIQFNAYGAADNTLSTIKSNVVAYTSTTDISSNLTFGTSPAGSATATEVMRVTPGTAAIPIGNVGIATTTPLAKLDVAYGDYQTSGALCIGADVGTFSTRTNASAKFGAISIPHFTNSSANCFLIGAYSNSLTTTTTAIGGGYTGINASTRVSLYTGATSTTSPGTETAYAVPAGFYLGSTSTLIFNASVSGQGIKLATTPANVDANTLDCYEEGTWTPVDRSGASLSFTAVAGTYTRIGRTVIAQCTLTYPSTANASDASFSLPIAMTTANTNFGGAAIGSVGALAKNNVTALIKTGATPATDSRIALITYNGAGAVTNANMSLVTIVVSVTYNVA